MKNRKRLLAMLLAGALSAGCLAGCGNNEVKQKSSEEQTANLSSQEVNAEGSAEAEASREPITTDPITISILTSRHGETTNDASELWCFKYLEYWMNQQGYNITIEVQQTNEISEQINLLLGTDSLPDIVWGIDLTPENAVVYGADEKMILDWNPYINEEIMPNVYKAFQEKPDALAASTCTDGGLYGLPCLGIEKYMTPQAGFGMVDRVYVDQKWLDECNLEMPTDIESFIDTLRAFKENIKSESGEEIIPLVSNSDFLQKYLWTGLGYYGSDLSAYGTEFAIKDGQVEFPAATDDYRTFIEVMRTLFEEGLISQDFFTMDATVMHGYTKSGLCGMVCDWTLTDTQNFRDMVAVPPVTLGDNDEIAISASVTYYPMKIWVSADTEYPEVIAKMLDYFYSDEGSVLLKYGPMEGQDPLNLLDGWYFDENGKVTTKLVEDGTYSQFTLYTRQYIYPTDYAGDLRNVVTNAAKMAGVDYSEKEGPVFTDSITGEKVNSVISKEYSEEDADGWWRITTTDTWGPYVTFVRLPGVYMSREDSVRAGELSTVLNQYISAESAKFITGIRPISELDAYFEELKKLGVEEYIEIYRTAYSTYMDSVF